MVMRIEEVPLNEKEKKALIASGELVDEPDEKSTGLGWFSNPDVPIPHDAPKEDITLEPLSMKEKRLVESQEIKEQSVQWFDDKAKLHDDLIRAYRNTSGSNPDAVASNMLLSDKTGISQWMIDEDPEVKSEAEKRVLPSALMDMAEKAPVSSMFFSVPGNMAIAHDDLENASMMELAVEGWNKGWQQSNVFREISGILTKDGINQDTLKQVYELAMGLPQEQKTEGFFQKAFYGGGEFMAQSVKAGMEGLEKGGWAAVAATIMTALFPASAPVGLAVGASGIGAAFGAGSSAGAFKEVFSQEFGAAFMEYVESGIDPETAFLTAFMVGGINGGIELAQIGTLMAAFPGSRKVIGALTGAGVKKLLAKQSFRKAITTAATRMGITGVAETAQEVTQENVNLVMRELARIKTGNEDIEPLTGQESLERSWEIVKEFGPAALLFGFLGAGSTVTADSWNAYKAAKTQAMLKELSGTAQESKLLKRYPSKFRHLVKSIGQNGGVEKVYVPVTAFQKYFQGSGGQVVTTPVEVARELGVETSYEEAVATGGKVEIPIEVAIERLAPSGHFEALVDDMSVNEDDLSVNEAKEEMSRFEEKVKGEWYEAQSAMDADESVRTSAEQVGEVVKTQLIASGMGAQEAERSASVIKARSVVAGQALGISPMRWLAKVGLSITGYSPKLTEKTGTKIRPEIADAEGVRFDPADFEVAQESTQGVVVTDTESSKQAEAAYLEEINSLMEAEAAYLEEINSLMEEDKTRRKDALDVIRKNGRLDYKSIVATFGKEEAQRLRKAIGAKMFAKEGGLHLDKAVQFLENFTEAEDDTELFRFLVGDRVKQYSQDGITYGQDGTIELNDNFYKWFGDSKVVDEQGKPLVVYHGTDAEFKEFKKEFLGKNTDWGDAQNVAKLGFWFSDKSMVDREFSPYSQQKEVYLQIKNPKDVSLDELFEIANSEEAVQEWKSDGFDGLRVDDTEFGGVSYVTFSPTQIKSVNNQGTWNPDDANIYHQPAYHGSPHRFDKFTLDHIGTGEGAQAYGWGLYFAGNKEVAKYYKEALSDWQPNGIQPEPGSVADKASAYVAVEIFNRSDVPYNVAIRKAKANGDTDVVEQIREWKETGVEFKKSGQLYEVDIPNDDVLLDWDKPLSEQSAKVKGIIFGDNDLGDYIRRVTEVMERNGEYEFSPTGVTAYMGFAEHIGSQKAASKYLNSLGIKGIKYLDGTSRSKGEGSYNYVIFDDEAIQILNTYYQENRGSIDLSDTRAIIRLIQASDMSTFLHESGHLFLKDIEQIARQKNAPAWVVRDYETILDWLGAEKGKPLTNEQHEKFARGFEAYLMEGNAPSSALRKAFESFKKWLTSIYAHVRYLNVDMNDDIRGVFDRMLATEEEITEAETRNKYDSFLEAVGTDMLPDDVIEGQRATADEAHEEAWRSLFNKAMRTTKKAWKNLKKQQLKDARKEVTREVENMPVYRALEEMSRPVSDGGIKLNRTVIAMAYGEDVANRLPKKIMSQKGAYNADMAAEFFGYNSGEQMIRDILEAPSKRDKIKELTEARVSDWNAMIEGGDMTGQAEREIRNGTRIDTIIAEISILRQIAQGVEKDNIKIERAEALRRKEAVRLAIESAVASMHPDKLNVGRYFRLEQKAIRDAFRAMEKGDYEAAAGFKEQQLVNHQMAITVMKEKAAIDKISKKLRGLEKKPPKGLPIEYLDQLDALFARVSMKRLSDKKLSEIKKLSAWISEQEDESLVAAIPERLRQESYKTNVKDMTVQELHDFANAVANIIHLGRLKGKLLTSKTARDLEATVDALVASKEKAIGEKGKPKRPLHPKKGQQLKDWLGAFNAWHLKIEFLCRVLDDFKDTGPWQEYIHQVFVDADQTETLLKEQAYGKLREILSVYSDDEWHDLQHRRRHFAAIGQELTKEDVLTLALNMGAKENRERVLNPKGTWGWTERQVWEVLDILDERDWQVVQDIWDHLETFWPAIEQLHVETAGFRPGKKEIVPVKTKYGVLRGGYYPIAYDSNQSFKAAQLSDKQLHESFNKGYSAFGHTNQGHTKEAVETTGLPLRLGFNVLNRHLADMLHDLAFRKAVIDIGKILRHDRVRDAVIDAFGLDGYRQFVSWHKAVASTRRDLFDPFAAAIKKARYGATIVAMGFKASVIVAQFLGYFTSAHLVGTGQMAISLVDFMSNPQNMWDDTLAKSDFMRHRKEGFDRDAKDALERMIGRDGLVRKVNVAALYAIGWADMMVSVPTWQAAYTKALSEGISGDRAVAYADGMVRKSQGSGHTYSLAAVQRGDQFGEFQKLFTMYYSFFSVLYNLMYSEVKYAQLKGVQPMKVAAAAFYLVIAPALLGELMTMRGPDDDEDPLVWAALEILGYIASPVVGVRDISSYALLNYNYRFTPVSEVTQSLGNLIKDVKEAVIEWDDSDEWLDILKSGYEAAGYITPFPSRQTQITAEGLYDWWRDDKDFRVSDVLYWRKK